jgi:phosphoserine phosphatase RsbU/P
MTSTTNAARPPRRMRAFWERVTEGLKIQQLWGQFLSEAKSSYSFYSKDVDWDEIGRKGRGPRRIWMSAWALFQALLMKLSPARRVLLLIAVIFWIFQPEISAGGREVNMHLGGIGTMILFILLALELADRVTMKRDLEIAQEIQQWLVPNKAPYVSGFDIAFATRPQNTVAGDYYDAFLRPLPDATGIQPLFVAVADVAGKSVPAALLMATFQASLRALSATPAPLEEIVIGLDRYCRAHSLEGRRFTTAFLAQINPQTREMCYTNAGHNDPILRRASGQMDRLSTGGPPFGLPLFSASEVAYGSATVQLQPGDLLVIFTDGVVEAENDRAEEFGESRLVPGIQSAPPESAADTLQRVMTQVNTFVGDVRQHDDITCLVLRVSA